MNVLLLARWPVGGIRTYFRYIYGHKSFTGFRFTLVAPDHDLSKMLATELSSTDFRYLPCDNSAVGLLRKAASELRRGDYQLVHSHGFTAGALVAPLCRLFQVPHLMTAHDVFQHGQFVGVRGRLKKALLAQLFRKIDVIHAVTNDGRDNFMEFFPSIDARGLHVIRHGVDVATFRDAATVNLRQEIGPAADTDYLIGFFGRFMAQKGFRYLVDAIGLIVNQEQLVRRPLVLTFGAGGFSREEYDRLRSKGLGNYFIQMPHSDNMPGVIKGVDLVAMPSLWEACGLLGMEALIAGVPIIGTNCIGLREVLEGTPASVVPPGDARALARKIEYEMTAGRRKEFEAYMPEAARRFSPERHVSELMELYTSMIKL